ncbi:hypothetical protein J6590_075153 [Homalodisca vitripennis]|nr:hypothetical protein J6590_075153 [Homalodisca vitripennis]
MERFGIDVVRRAGGGNIKYHEQRRRGRKSESRFAKPRFGRGTHIEQPHTFARPLHIQLQNNIDTCYEGRLATADGRLGAEHLVRVFIVSMRVDRCPCADWPSRHCYHSTNHESLASDSICVWHTTGLQPKGLSKPFGHAANGRQKCNQPILQHRENESDYTRSSQDEVRCGTATDNKRGQRDRSLFEQVPNYTCEFQASIRRFQMLAH